MSDSAELASYRERVRTWLGSHAPNVDAISGTLTDQQVRWERAWFADRPRGTFTGKETWARRRRLPPTR